MNTNTPAPKTSAIDQTLTRRQYMKLHKKQSLFRLSVRTFMNNRLAVIGTVIFSIVLFLAVFADVIADYDTKVILIDPIHRLMAPGAEHILGTDELGRDVFARLIHGGRISLRIGFLAVALSTFIGLVLGACAGYYGGLTDTIIMRCTDIFACLPSMLLAIAIVAAFGNTEFNLLMAIAVSRVPAFARVVRSAVMSVQNMDYVEAARAIGARDHTIIFKHVLVNCLGPIIVQMTMSLAASILAISSLSFIGLGISAPTPEWGSMLSTARTYMRDYPFLVVAPGMAIFLSSLSLNLMGDGLRDALDPRMRK